MAEALTPEQILRATEEVLRRYGPAKATVVDVARALGVSHGTVYRHFRTKAALREAVTKRWLDRTTEQLESVAERQGPAEERLVDWLTGLFAAKRRKAGDDPELFATYTSLVGEHSEAVDQHVTDLEGQLARIIEDGRAQGTFTGLSSGPDTAARAVFQATARFHDPSYAPQWSDPSADADFEAVRDLILRGLTS
ncbi:TetR family transcriptional regulator [Streptomyces sp. PT12]|uniref:TetR family transcriptional regulator n=1 Tax=Streptomyces sp. PT12 TaxID=1510197 RepID=UPI000DE1EB88|nr:TetR family transcriptional regulator [Streptomyces sp. PT12]RBM20227.1 TetR family transcriptional regulator [Streptomyces sp. PT12]